MMELPRYGSGRFYGHKILWSTIFLVSLSLGAGYAYAQGDLAVYINTDREVYRVGDSVQVTFTTVNETGRTLRAEGGCIQPFKLMALNLDEEEVWNSGRCPICCCTCCGCAFLYPGKEIPLGETQFENAAAWNQVQTLRVDVCGCVNESVKPGFYYLVGQVLDAVSDPILIEIQ